MSKLGPNTCYVPVWHIFTSVDVGHTKAEPNIVMQVQNINATYSKHRLSIVFVFREQFNLLKVKNKII